MLANVTIEMIGDKNSALTQIHRHWQRINQHSFNSAHVQKRHSARGIAATCPTISRESSDEYKRYNK